MAVYTFICGACGAQVEQLRSFSRADQPIGCACGGVLRRVEVERSPASLLSARERAPVAGARPRPEAHRFPATFDNVSFENAHVSGVSAEMPMDITTLNVSGKNVPVVFDLADDSVLRSKGGRHDPASPAKGDRKSRRRRRPKR